MLLNGKNVAKVILPSKTINHFTSLANVNFYNFYAFMFVHALYTSCIITRMKNKHHHPLHPSFLLFPDNQRQLQPQHMWYQM